MWLISSIRRRKEERMLRKEIEDRVREEYKDELNAFRNAYSEWERTGCKTCGGLGYISPMSNIMEPCPNPDCNGPSIAPVDEVSSKIYNEVQKEMSAAGLC